MSSRCCSRTACRQPPVYTLTYVYRDSTAVLGPLAAYVEPHCYDLCATHAERLTVPRGWDVVRLPGDPVQQSVDDLEALANAVREASQQQRQRSRESQGPPGPEPVGQGIEVGRRRHLRMVRSAPPETAPPGEPAGGSPPPSGVRPASFPASLPVSFSRVLACVLARRGSASRRGR